MPKFFKQNLLTPPHLLTGALDEPELPPPHEHHEMPEEPEEYDDPAALDQSQSYDEREDRRDPVRTLLTWKAPSRPFRKKDRSYYTTAAILIILVSLIAILAGEKLLIGALFALLFFIYVLGFVAPEEVEYKISAQGITVGDHFYHWRDLDSFWIDQKDGVGILNVQTYFKFPGRLLLVTTGTNEEQIKKAIARYLPFREIVPKSLIEHWSEGLQKHFPLENPSH